MKKHRQTKLEREREKRRSREDEEESVSERESSIAKREEEGIYTIVQSAMKWKEGRDACKVILEQAAIDIESRGEWCRSSTRFEHTPQAAPEKEAW